MQKIDIRITRGITVSKTCELAMHNRDGYFSITHTVKENGICTAGGCGASEYFPEYEKFEKWHLNNGLPMYYVENSLCHFGLGSKWSKPNWAHFVSTALVGECESDGVFEVLFNEHIFPLASQFTDAEIEDGAWRKTFELHQMALLPIERAVRDALALREPTLRMKFADAMAELDGIQSRILKGV